MSFIRKIARMIGRRLAQPWPEVKGRKKGKCGERHWMVSADRGPMIGWPHAMPRRFQRRSSRRRT